MTCDSSTVNRSPSLVIRTCALDTKLMHLRTLYNCLVEPEIAEKSGVSDSSFLSMFAEGQEPSKMAGHIARKESF